MKYIALALALATACGIASPASAQSQSIKGMTHALHGPDDTPACLDRLNSLEKRMTRCKEAIREGHFGLWLEMAKLQRIAGDYDGALASVAMWTNRLPDIPTTYSTTNSSDWISVLQVRSEIYAQMGKFAEASKDGDEIQGIDSDSAHADNGQCWLRAVAGQGIGARPRFL